MKPENFKSRYDWNTWIESLIRTRHTPSGKNLKREIYVCDPGENVIFTTGHQTFGSGGYVATWCWCSKDGTPPEVRRYEAADSETRFTSDTGWEVILPDNCLVFTASSDVFRENYRVVVATSDETLFKALEVTARYGWGYFDGDPIECLKSEEGRKKIAEYHAYYFGETQAQAQV